MLPKRSVPTPEKCNRVFGVFTGFRATRVSRVLANIQKTIFQLKPIRMDGGRSALQRAVLLSLVAFGLVFSLLAKANAETRTLRMYYTHTKESITVTFKRNGRYDKRGLRKLNRFLRDFRRNEPTRMDPKLFDLVWEVYQKSGSRKPIHVISGYRSPRTNKMLRRRGRKVARKSQHTRGKALDFFLPDVSVSKLRALGLKAHAGGVGYYRRSFVHLDTGRVRHWPRMSRRQLSRVFPRGRTIHIPSNGKPLRGYKVAMANLKRGRNYDGTRRRTKASRTLLARILRPSGNDGDENEKVSKPAPKPPAKKPEPVVVAAKPQTPKKRGPDPFAREVAEAKRAAEAKAKAEAEAAQEAQEFAPARVPLPKIRPEPAAPVRQPETLLAELESKEIANRTQLALLKPAGTNATLRPSVDVPAAKDLAPQDKKALEALKSRMQTALARQRELSAAERAVESQANNTALASKVQKLLKREVSPERFEQPAVQVALAPTSDPKLVNPFDNLRRIAVPTPASRAALVAKAETNAVEAAKVPVPSPAPSVVAKAEVSKPDPNKPEFVASVKPRAGETVEKMTGELKLGDLEGSSVKAWAIAASTRVGPIAALKAPDYEVSTKRLAPAKVYSAGFANDRPPLRSDRFTGRALIRLALADLRSRN